MNSSHIPIYKLRDNILTFTNSIIYAYLSFITIHQYPSSFVLKFNLNSYDYVASNGMESVFKGKPLEKLHENIHSYKMSPLNPGQFNKHFTS